MIRLKRDVLYTVVERTRIPAVAELPVGMKQITSDWIVRLPGWTTDRLFRLVSYQLTDGTLIRVLTSRLDLPAVSVTMLYKERWSIELWWKWLKEIYTVKAPLGDNANALQLQIIAAFALDLMFRVFKERSGYSGSLYEFVVSSREMLLCPLDRLAGGLQQAYLAITKLEISTALPSDPSQVS